MESSLNLFRHYYHIKRTGGFYYMCGRLLSKDFLAKSKGPSTGWQRRYFMVKKRNFSEGMKWKEGSGRDLKPNLDISPLDLENLESVKPMLQSSVKSVHLEQIDLWTRQSEPSHGEDNESMSRVGTGIILCMNLR